MGLVPQMWSIFMWNNRYMNHMDIISPPLLEKCLRMWEPKSEFFSPPLLIRIVMLGILQVLMDNKLKCHDHQNTFQTLIHLLSNHYKKNALLPEIFWCNKLKIVAINTYCNEKFSLPTVAKNSLAMGYRNNL